jgi:hypothetical protein
MSGTSYGSWIGIKCRHPDGRTGNVTDEFLGPRYTMLTITVDGTNEFVPIAVSGSEPNIGLGWKWLAPRVTDTWYSFDD